MRCFVHFHFKMCFSPGRGAIFRHQNFKKCFEPHVFCTFSLQNVLFATAACNFSFLCWAPTSSPAALRGLIFDWPDTRIIEKTQHFATSLIFGADVSSFFWLSRYCIFFLLTWLLYSAFQLSILSEVWFLNFLRQPPRIRDLLTGMILQVGKQILELFNRALVTSQTFFETTPKNPTKITAFSKKSKNVWPLQ